MPAFVQSASNAVSSTSVAKAFVSPNTLGNCLVAFVGVFNTGTFSTPTVTDSQGNTWVKLLSAPQLYPSGISASGAYVFVAYNCKAGANTVTATISPSLAISISILEYSGVALANARDQIMSSARQFSSTVFSGSITTQHNNEVILSCGYDQSGNHPLTPTSGWVQRETVGASRNLTVWEQAVSSTGTFSNTITTGAGSNALHAIILSLADVSTPDVLVQSVANTAQSSPVSVTFTKPNVAGNVLFLAIGRKVSTTLGAINTVSDTRGNTWTLLASSPAVSGLSQAHLYVCSSCLAGANTVTVSTTISDILSIAALEYTGQGNSAASGVSTTGLTLATGNFSAAAGALVLSVGFNHSVGGGITSDFSGIGWKQRENETSTDASFGNFGSGLSVFDQIIPTSQTIEQTISVAASSSGLHLISSTLTPPLVTSPSAMTMIPTPFGFQPRIQDTYPIVQPLTITVSGGTAWACASDVPWLLFNNLSSTSGVGSAVVQVSLFNVPTLFSSTLDQYSRIASASYTGTITVTSGGNVNHIPVTYVSGYGDPFRP